MRCFSGILYLMVGVIVFTIDRLSKLYALSFWYDQPSIVNRFLSFEVTFNRGISWGMLHSESNTIFIFVLFINSCITAFLVWYAYYRFTQRNSIFGEILVIIGSFSNIVDRIYYHGVVDFILFSYNQWSFPVFNVADVAIVIGVGIILYQQGIKS